MSDESRARVTLTGLFFFSGLTSLVYEITWSRILSTIIGNTSLAVSLIVAIFMAGLGLGSFFAARLRQSEKPILIYGFLEGFIGLYSLMTPRITVWIETIYGGAYAATADDFLRSVLLKAGLAAILLLAFTFLRRKTPAILRRIEAYERLNRAVGLAVENGTRLHISLGRGNLFTARGGSALAGLALLRRIAERTSVSDQPPIATSGDATLAILSQDTMLSGYRAAGAEEQRETMAGEGEAGVAGAQ